MPVLHVGPWGLEQHQGMHRWPSTPRGSEGAALAPSQGRNRREDTVLLREVPMGCSIPTPPLWPPCCLVNCSAVPHEHLKRKKKKPANNCVNRTVPPIFLNGRYPKPLSAAEKPTELNAASPACLAEPGRMPAVSREGAGWGRQQSC